MSDIPSSRVQATRNMKAKIEEQDQLIRELMDGRHRDLEKMREMKALIRELVAALERIVRSNDPEVVHMALDVLTKARAAGAAARSDDPRSVRLACKEKTGQLSPYHRDATGEDC